MYPTLNKYFHSKYKQEHDTFFLIFAVFITLSDNIRYIAQSKESTLVLVFFLNEHHIHLWIQVPPQAQAGVYLDFSKCEGGKGDNQNSKWQLSMIDPNTKCHFIWGLNGG